MIPLRAVSPASSAAPALPLAALLGAALAVALASLLAAPSALGADDLAPPNSPQGRFTNWYKGPPLSVPSEDAALACGPWSAIGPFPSSAGEHDAQVDQPLPPEHGIDPDATYPGVGRSVSWRPVPWFGLCQVDDLITALGAAPVPLPLGEAAAYVATTLHAAADGKVWVVIGFWDGGKLWLNGKEIIRSNHYGPTQFARYMTLLDVHQGGNPVLIKVIHKRKEWQAPWGLQEYLGAWDFDLRLTDGECHKYGSTLERALDAGTLSAADAKRAHARLARWYDDLADHDWAFYHARLAARADPTDQDRAVLARLIQLQHDGLGDGPGYDALAIDLLHHDRIGLSDTDRWRMQTTLVGHLLTDKDVEAAVREAEWLASQEGDTENHRSLCLLAGQAHEQLRHNDKALASYRAAILANPQPDDCTTEALQGIWRIRSELADPMQGLSHAALLAAIAKSPTQFDLALGLVAHGLEEVDGDLRRVSPLYQRHWYGPAGKDGTLQTRDDPADPLAAVPMPHDPEWRQALVDRLQQLSASDAAAGQRMYLQLMLGDTAAAVRTGVARQDGAREARDADLAMRDLVVAVRAASGSATLADCASRVDSALIAGAAPAAADLALARANAVPLRSQAAPSATASLPMRAGACCAPQSASPTGA